MTPILMIDFGSTYTKVTCVDLDARALVGTAQSYTTVEEDIGVGLERALNALAAQTGVSAFAERYACSSAAGGLRMVASGLVPSLTAEAAKRAALGAGAKVVKTYAYELTEDDLGEIAALAPDILLLCGGTDGGNRACVEHNARAIASMPMSCPVVLAGNRASTRVCVNALGAAGREVIPCENVMPQFNQLNVASCQSAIRDVFLRRIISAKGLSKAQALISGILMPTPAAVMDALNLLSESLGELAAVDLGGATTDIYSITAGFPTKPNVLLRGLPEPYAKRTVEGDIGMRYSAPGVVAAAGLSAVVEASGQGEAAVNGWIERIRVAPGILPDSPEAKDIDFALASLAIEVGLARHAGSVEEVYTPMGVAYQQTGKDLTQVSRLILTGGALIRSGRAREMAERAMATTRYPSSLMPRGARILTDSQYLLSAMGLLSQKHPDLARELMMKEFH